MSNLQRAVVFFLFVTWETGSVAAGHRRGEDREGQKAGGIELLTEQTREEAIACGKAGAACAVTPYLLCPSNPRYSTRLATPYSRVAFSVYHAERTGRPGRPPSRGVANGWGVGLFVSPADGPQTADSIEKVLLRRGNETIEPLTTTLAPVLVQRAEGKVRLSKGFFAFPRDSFKPVSDITLVFIGPSGEMTCVVDHRHLVMLR